MPPPIDAVDIPEIAYPDYLILAEPPVDEYQLMFRVDNWAAKQAIDDTDLKQHGLAWLALGWQARLNRCAAYLGAVQDRAQNAREVD